MQSKIILIVLCFFCLITVFSQKKIDIKLEPKVWDASKKNIQRFIVSLKRESDTCTYINGNSICDFQILKLRLQDSGKYFIITPLTILFGTNDQDQVVVIVDKNKNDSYNDDSVYLIDFKSYKNQIEFFHSVPIIKIDSMQYFTDNNVRLFYNAILKIAPSGKSGRHFSHKEEFVNSKQINIDFYVTNYYSGVFEQNNIKYEIAIVPHPIVYPHINIANSKYDYRTTYINTYQKTGDGKDSLLSFNIVANYLKSNKNQEYIRIGKSLFSLESISINDSLLISLVEVEQKSAIQEQDNVSYPEAVQLINTRSSQKEKIIVPAFSNYLLLHFTGSWCLPCETSLPELKEFERKNKAIIHVVSVQKENSLKQAKEYLNSKKITWDCYFEKFSCLEEDCYERKLSVSAYPSFLLFTKTGELVLRTEGDRGLEEINKALIKLRIVR